jgi:23S rRNA pseudouridine1911/1915/1917 synthase
MSFLVRYEDADCVVVDKPAGVVVHPATSHRHDTLVHGLLDRYPELAQMVDSGPDGVRPGIVHRLDKDTSGLLVVARHEAAQKALQAQFQARQVTKVYRTLLHGRLGEPQGRIVLPLGRDPHNRQRMAVVPDGREAITEYEVESFLLTPHGARESFTLVMVRLVTGRTHQIRVHFAHMGHPVVGDAVYGRRKTRAVCPRQFLHAWRLTFLQPTDGTPVAVESPLPADLEEVLARLEAVI